MAVRALCIGGAPWDELVTLDALPAAGQLVPARSRTGAAGGVARSALALERLGFAVTVSARCGTGPGGDRVRAELEAARIHCRFATTGTDMTSTILLVDGDRTIIGPPPGRSTVEAPTVDASGCALVLCATSDVDTFVRTLATASTGTLSSYDAGDAVSPERLHAARRSAIVTGRPAFFTALAPEGHRGNPAAAGARELLQAGAVAVAVTYGPDPVQLFTQDGSHDVPPPAASAVVDTCGAGDVFHAVLAGSMALGADPRQAAHEAVTAATRHCTVLGNGNLRRR